GLQGALASETRQPLSEPVAHRTDRAGTDAGDLHMHGASARFGLCGQPLRNADAGPMITPSPENARNGVPGTRRSAGAGSVTGGPAGSASLSPRTRRLPCFSALLREF